MSKEFDSLQDIIRSYCCRSEHMDDRKIVAMTMLSNI